MEKPESLPRQRCRDERQEEAETGTGGRCDVGRNPQPTGNSRRAGSPRRQEAEEGEAGAVQDGTAADQPVTEEPAQPADKKIRKQKPAAAQTEDQPSAAAQAGQPVEKNKKKPMPQQDEQMQSDEQSGDQSPGKKKMKPPRPSRSSPVQRISPAPSPQRRTGRTSPVIRPRILMRARRSSRRIAAFTYHPGAASGSAGFLFVARRGDENPCETERFAIPAETLDCIPWTPNSATSLPSFPLHERRMGVGGRCRSSRVTHRATSSSR